jgi:hypothetical protein
MFALVSVACAQTLALPIEAVVTGHRHLTPTRRGPPPATFFARRRVLGEPAPACIPASAAVLSPLSPPPLRALLRAGMPDAP